MTDSDGAAAREAKDAQEPAERPTRSLADQPTLARINPICDRFEDAWQSQSRPRIADYLDQVSGPDRTALFEYLLEVEIDYRVKAGDVPAEADYERDYPDFGDSISKCFRSREGGEIVPEVIGKYRVIGKLGEGGQAEVFRVGDPQLNRELVVKRSLDLPIEADRDRLVQEGQVLAQLKHPHLVPVHDLGFDEGRPYLVMEYVTGRTLRQLAKDERLTPVAAARLIGKVARALGAAHRNGVVHQDVKPENIVIDRDGEPRLIDFGIASWRKPWNPAEPPPIGISGTVPYMAPEQARGEEVGPKSDQFGLAGVLYFLLSGKPPFDGRTFEEALERARQGEFDRAALERGSPWSLASVCLRGMHRDPARRYDSIDQFADAVERYTARSGRRTWLLAAAVGVAALTVLFWPSPASPPDLTRHPDGRDLANAFGIEVRLSGEHAHRGSAYQFVDGEAVDLVVTPEIPCHLGVWYVDPNQDPPQVQLLFPTSADQNPIRPDAPCHVGIEAFVSEGATRAEYLHFAASKSAWNLEEGRRLGPDVIFERADIDGKGVRVRNELPVSERVLPFTVSPGSGNEAR